MTDEACTEECGWCGSLETCDKKSSVKRYVTRESFETLKGELKSTERWLRNAESKIIHQAMMIDQLIKERGYDEFVVFDAEDGHKSIRMKSSAEIQAERDDLKAALDRQKKINEAYKWANPELARHREAELRVWQKAYLVIAENTPEHRRAVIDEMADLAKRNGVLTDRLNRAVVLYTKRCEATADGCTDAEEMFLADLSEILRGES